MWKPFWRWGLWRHLFSWNHGGEAFMRLLVPLQEEEKRDFPVTSGEKTLGEQTARKQSYISQKEDHGGDLNHLATWSWIGPPEPWEMSVSLMPPCPWYRYGSPRTHNLSFIDKACLDHGLDYWRINCAGASLSTESGNRTLLPWVLNSFAALRPHSGLESTLLGKKSSLQI